ncbi:TldD/PmbA family protein [Bacillus sp. FJAT-49736]|uniref:TldD/PmbA family protein n=1 Tax=Bacillus sp. FJAT-49736 TaxID=2833582 RepID=UPI001BCA1862|nr:TldD/PmbA family protein [Bacillus sp. FJAT-49736]MBS4172971.1 TldD/PmbA family protein [Bacillus sp. FJAT-49736]
MNLQDFQAKLFDEAKQAGFTDVEVYFEKTEVFGCQIFKGEIDEYEIAEEGGISFRGLYQEKMGYSYAEKISEDSIPFLIYSAKENSLVMEDDETEEIFAGSDSYEEANFFSTELDEVSIPEKIQLIKDIEKEILQYDPRITATDTCNLKSMSTTRAISNSKGLFLQDKQNYLFFMINAIAKDGEETKTAYKFFTTKDFKSLDPKQIAKEAAEESLSFLGAKSIENKDYPILLRNDAAAQLLATFSPVFSAENTQAGKSLLHNKLGEKIANTNVSIVDNPLLETGLASRTFDGEGVATKKLAVVEDGVLKSLLHNQKTAKKDGTVTTGHASKESYKSALAVGPSNFYIQPSAKSFEELLSTIEEGVLITELSGLHSGTNQISGDFSVAANGYYIKNGKVETPVNLMTIAGNFYDLLNNIEEVGADLMFPFYHVGSPTVKINSLSVTVE